MIDFKSLPQRLVDDVKAILEGKKKEKDHKHTPHPQTEKKEISVSGSKGGKGSFEMHPTTDAVQAGVQMTSEDYIRQIFKKR